MSKHTPGRWRVSSAFLGEKALIEHGDAFTQSPIVASVYSDGGRLPTQANARLIAKAPDLFKLAQRIRDYFGDDEIDPFLDGDIALRDTARELIEEIEGES